MARPRTTTRLHEQFLIKVPSVMVPGTVISQSSLCAHFNITAPDITSAENLSQVVKMTTNFVLAKTNAYTGVNKLLAAYGLVIRQETIGDTIQYRVQTEAEVERKITSYKKASRAKTTQARALGLGNKIARREGRYRNPLIPGIEV